MFGQHPIKHWSTSQAVIALSSGEAEYYGCVKAGSVAIGIKSMLKDMGVTKDRIRIKTDASVAKSLAARRGLGGIKHIEVNQLWLQEKVNNGQIESEKVRTDVNLADALTKFKEQASIVYHLKETHQDQRSGRHEIMPALSKKVGPNDTSLLTVMIEEGEANKIFQSKSFPY